MRILFFYSEDIRDRNKADFVHREILDSLQMNFDAEWRFKVEKQPRNRFVCHALHCKPLPDGIFYRRGVDNVDVSAIVGENGSGKTSFARMMHRISLDPKGIRLLLVAEIDGKLCAWGNSISVEFTVDNDSDEDRSCIASLNEHINKSFRGIEDAFRFVYYSPVYTSQHVLDTAKHADFNGDRNFFYDVSTTGLLRHSNGGWKEFERQEFMSVLDYASGVGGVVDFDGKEPTAIPYVHGIRVEIDWDVLKEAEGFFLRLSEKFLKENGRGGRLPKSSTGVFLKSLTSIIPAFGRCKLLVAHFLYAFALCSWYGRYLGEDGHTPLRYDCRLLAMLAEMKECAAKNTPSASDAVERAFNKFLRYLRRSKEESEKALAWYGLYEALTPDDGPRYSSKSGICYVFKKFGDDDCLRQLLKSYATISSGVDFLKIEPRPRVSSGEWAILSIMNRIYSLGQQIDGRNVVLFFDEAETSFHPNWQRKLVSDIIGFCSLVFQDSHFHVIFATHSPIILSDIPSSNIVFLRKKAGKKSLRVNVEDEVRVEEYKGKTFGANIYDLFRDSFFLKDGPVGELARAKIAMILDEIARRIAPARQKKRTRDSRSEIAIEDWIDLLGDAVLVRYIQKLKDAGILK